MHDRCAISIIWGVISERKTERSASNRSVHKVRGVANYNGVRTQVDARSI
jgi:hypothetical protein